MCSTRRFRVSRIEPRTRNAMMPQLTTTDSGMESPKTETISTFSSSFKAAVNAFILFALSPFSFCGMYHSTIVPKFVAARPRFYLLLYSISRSAEKCCTLRTNTRMFLMPFAQFLNQILVFASSCTGKMRQNRHVIHCLYSRYIKFIWEAGLRCKGCTGFTSSHRGGTAGGK